MERMEPKQFEEFSNNFKEVREVLARVEEKISAKDNLGLYGTMSMRELYALSKRKVLTEKLQGFYESDIAKLTVKELLTSTSNVALPTMVQSRALLELANWADLRDISMLADVPKGAGKTFDVQIITQPTFDEWTEGNALAAADPGLTKRTGTVKPFGKVTKISDLLANTSAKGTCMHVPVD